MSTDTPTPVPPLISDITDLLAPGVFVVQVTRQPGETGPQTRIAIQSGDRVTHADIDENVIARAPNPRDAFQQVLAHVLACAAKTVREANAKPGDAIVVAKEADMPATPPKNRLRRLT